MKNKNDNLIAELENRFADYKNISKNIRNQKAFLNQRETDENNGGGRSSFISKPTETEAIKNVSDDYIQQQEKDFRAIEDTLKELGAKESELIQRKYWGDCSWMTWKEFAMEVHYSSSSISRLKQKTLMIFGRKINRVGDWD